MIVVVDKEYRYAMANRAFLNYRRVGRDLIGRFVLEQLASDGATAATLDLVEQKMDECFQGKVVEYELSYKYPYGVDRIACVLRDITERKRAEEALRCSEENYRNFVSQRSEGIFREDLDTPVPIDLPEDQLVHHVLYDT